MTIQPDHFYSTKELGELLGVGPKAIAIKCTKGEIRHTRIATRLVIPGDAVIEYLRRETCKPPKKKAVAK